MLAGARQVTKHEGRPSQDGLRSFPNGRRFRAKVGMSAGSSAQEGVSMASQPDGDQRTKTVDVAVMPTKRGWSVPGGTEDDDSHTVWVITFGPEGESRRYAVTLPLSVADDGALVVGEVTIAENPEVE